MPFLKSKIQLFLIGFTAILSQLIVLREFLNVFEGNELIIGLYFCIWMSLTGLGSYSAGDQLNVAMIKIQVFFCS